MTSLDYDEGNADDRWPPERDDWGDAAEVWNEVFNALAMVALATIAAALLYAYATEPPAPPAPAPAPAPAGQDDQ